MVALPIIFFCLNGFEIKNIGSGPFYGLALIFTGFPLSGFTVHFYSTVIHEFIFSLALPANEQGFMFYQSYIQWMVEWVLAFMAGYFQWFVCLPWIWSKAWRKAT